MFYLVVNERQIGISTKTYPIRIEDCVYVWKDATMQNSPTEYSIKNSSDVFVAFYPRSSTVIFADITQLEQKGVAGNIIFRKGV